MLKLHLYIVIFNIRRYVQRILCKNVGFLIIANLCKHVLHLMHVWDLKYSERVNIPGVYLVSTYSGVLLTHEQNSIYTLYACAIAQYILYRIFEKWIKCWNQYTWRTTSLYLKAMMNESRILRCLSCYFVRWWCGEMHPIRPRFVANISDQCPQQK